jgi:predicted phosphodiesterase
MKFIALSDTHFEFSKVNYFPLNVEDMKSKTLILAGDINVGLDNLVETLVSYAKDFKHVVYVAGNHDHYDTEYGDLQHRLRLLETTQDNIHFLDCSTVVIDGVCIGGATMWGIPTSRLNDTKLIGLFKRKDMQDIHKQHVKWIKENAANVDIMVTHFCPGADLGNPNYPPNELTDYFCPRVVPDMTVLPPVWIFGHTHYSRDEFYRATHFISNQVGYPGELKPLKIKEYNYEATRTNYNTSI